MKKMLYLIWVVGALLVSFSSTFAQSNRHWGFAPDGFNIPQGQLMQAQFPKEYRLARLDVPALYQELSDAHRRPADAPPLLISIPNPEGGYSEFFISPTTVVADEVAHLYTVKTFKGYAKNSRQVSIRCDISPTGFHAAVFSGDITYVIEPASRSDVNAHIVYYKSDLEVPGFRCGVDDTHRRSGYKPSDSGTPKTPANLRTYRLAIIADATYRTQFGGMPYNATNVLNSFASGINMVNAVYERDLGVHLTLVSNTTCADAVLTDHTDIDEVHTFIATSSGLDSDGFDVGHSLLWANTGGVAYLGVVCNTSLKGGGFSGSNGSVTQLYVDYMAHELGHQFGGDHTFASSECGTSEPNFRYETGEGSTIMAYAGVCGAAPSYQNFSDPYFHAASIGQINTYISSGGTCAAISTPGTGNNAAPTANAQSDFTIPKQTPFILVGAGTDANSDPITFSWEQFNGSGAATTGSPNCNTTTQPLFRFRPPTSNNYRVFPQMSDVLAGNNNTPAWEKLPCVARTLNFRMTARDNNTNWGRTANDNMVVTVADTGPFNVTAPNGGESWATSSTQNVTWAVNGTDAHCINVDVLVSTDNGVTYTVLGTFPNNGSASVTMPATTSFTARVLVQCSVGGNFRSASTFFDVSNAVFAILDAGCGSAYWNMTAASAASNTISNTSVGNITQGNSNGAVTMLSATSASSGYTGVSGGNNAAVAARTGALNTGASGSAYFEIAVTPNAGTIFTLNGISFGSRSTSTGPQAYSVRTSADNYATEVAGGTLLNNSTWALQSNTGLSVASGSGTPLTIRIYGHSGTGSPTAGQANWRIDDLTINGCNEPAVTCPTLTSAPGEVQITDSACGTGCTVSAGSIAAPTMGCPTGSSIQYNVNGGGWTSTLPTYAAGLTIQTRCLCDTDANTTSPASTGVMTNPGTCVTPGTPTLTITNNVCPSTPGSISATGCGAGTIVEYAIAPGGPWSPTAPAYTASAFTVYARCRNTTTNCVSSTVSETTNPTACTTCPDLSTAPGEVQITNSTCGTGCTVTGGSIAAPTMGCPTGSSIQYNVNGGGWNTNLPTYAAGLTIQTRCLCDTDANTTSPTSTGVMTNPGTCVTPGTPTLTITNNVCPSTPGSISATGCGAGTIVEYAIAPGGPWSSTAPAYTASAFTVYARCRNTTTNCVSSTVSETTNPTACTTCPDLSTAPGEVQITNSTCGTGCTVTGGSIAVPTMGCPTGSSIQYNVNGGGWTSTLPTYAAGLTIQTRCLCDTDANTTSPASTGVMTNPGTCVTPGTPTLTITNNVCPSTPGSISATGCGAGTIVEYAIAPGGPWSSTAPAYTASAFTVYARCRNTTTDCVSSTVSEATQPVLCPTPCGNAYWNMTTEPVTTNTVANTSFGDIGRGNNNGTTTLITTASVSSGYLGASGSGNAGAAARIGALNTGANGSAYFEVAVTPDAGTVFTLNGISFGSRSTGTGPLAYSIRTSANNYATEVAGGALLSNSVWALQSNTGLSVASGAGQPLTIRIYGYNGAGSPGAGTANWRIDDLTISGCNDPSLCPALTSAPGEVQITNSTCGTGCTASGGNIAAPTTGCPSGSSIQYSTNGGQSWSTNLPAYNQTGPAQTIQTRCLCDTDANTFSQASAGVTTAPPVCSQPLNITCVNGAVNFNGQSSIALTPAALVQITGGCQIQNITANPASILCTQVGQTVPVTITVTDQGGITSTCTSQITVSGLPCNWQSANVNCNEPANNVAFNTATGQWTITSSDCYYASPFTADEMVYARRQLCGDGSITALVTGINPLADGWAGVVMRETSDAGAKKAQLMTNLSSLHRREFRIATNGQSFPQQFQSNGRYWLRIVRTGNQFTMHTSPNGTAWYVVGSQSITMQSCIQVGLVVTSSTANGTVTATFSNVGFTQLNPPSVNNSDVQATLGQIEFDVFPNPTSGQLNIDLTQYAGKPVRIEMYSLEGKLLKFTEMDEVQTTVETLDLSQFQRGMYLVRVKSEGLPDATRKVVLNR